MTYCTTAEDAAGLGRQRWMVRLGLVLRLRPLLTNPSYEGRSILLLLDFDRLQKLEYSPPALAFFPFSQRCQ